MIEYKNSSDCLTERKTSANLGGPISLTWLWEIIVRTKRLPDDLDLKLLFLVLRDRLRNLEKEVRQHALRVLADLIPLIEKNTLDKHMECLLPDLIVNLSHGAPAVRKGTVDVLRVYINHTTHSNEVLKSVMTAVPEDNHLRQGLLMAVPYFSTERVTEDTLVFLLKQLLSGTDLDFFRETSICSLVKTRTRLGAQRFNNLLGDENLKKFQELCKEQNIHLEEKDNVILETEITLDTGPAITMQIREEEENSAANSSDERRDFDDSESELISRSPRKVHFGGEVVKMRTPESDSNQNSGDDSDLQTSVIIDRPTSIKITLSDNVAAIKTRHKSMIPIRVTTGSNPSTPSKKLKPKRLHKSAPDLGKIQTSKIPLPNPNNEKTPKLKVTPPKEIKSCSPAPPHNPIEMFHNLTRSPLRSPEIEEFEDRDCDRNIFPSFQLCAEESKEEKVNSAGPLEGIVRDLSHNDDTWTKTRALDDLITVLRKNSIKFDNISIPQLFESLLLLEKQQRLHNKAQEALSVLISSMNSQSFDKNFQQLCNCVIRVSSPSGVRLALQVMKKSTPRKFFEALKVEPNDREVALQALIAATRTYPSSEIELSRGIQLAFESMKDSKRSVRQAALESLASLAQVAGNSMILDAIAKMSENNDDSNLLTIVRTRLSRRQLPTVDVDGNIRYSSPREQEEFDWLCGGVSNLPKTSSLNSIKPSSNYWRRNLRHETELPIIRSPSLLDSFDESNDRSKDAIWAVDASSFPKIENGTERGTFYPLYVLHKDSHQVNGKTYRNYDRGRSNSPPHRRQSHGSQELYSDINGNKAKRHFRQNEQFKKSFSSEHIYSGHTKNVEPTSFSLSSRSSTTSTGSSTKSGIWLKEFRSGIPVPINPDTKLKFRSHRQSELYGGPLIAQDPMNSCFRKRHVAPEVPIPIKPKSAQSQIKVAFENEETNCKLESPQDTPVIRRTSAQKFTPSIPPHSSGSESSGYFTPPAEHHLKDQTQGFVPDESFEENNNSLAPSEPNFQIIESEASETHELDDEQRQSSASSVETTRKIESFEQNQEEDEKIEETRYSPLDEVDFEAPRNFDHRSKSRSEGNLKGVLPEITRKNINSAPPLNDISLVPYSYTFSESVDSNLVKAPLPGSVTSNDNTPTKQPSDQSPKRLMRRSISVRTQIRKVSKSPKPIEVKSLNRPKEILNQSLAQMESCDWESNMKGLNSLIRTAQNNPEVLELQIHSICTALAKNIKNLRSQVARAACHAATEIFSTCKKGLDTELEEVAAPLLQRTADTNKFLRSDANAALDAMCLNLSTPKVVAVVAAKGAVHQNGVVRAASTRLLSDMAMRIGPEKVFQLPKESRDKILTVGANGLTEGSLDTRRHAKALMSTLARHHQFQKALTEAVPQHTMRHISKILNSLK